MVQLTLHGRRVDSVFSLLGERENDITFSLGWALSRGPAFLKGFLNRALPTGQPFRLEELAIALQKSVRGAGITDIEILGGDFHVIVEAKRGWYLPARAQLEKYVPRFRKSKARHALIVTMSECSNEYARQYLAPEVDGVPVQHMSWNQIGTLSRLSKGNHAEKRLMHVFQNYIATIVNMQPQQSNWVYVVSLSTHVWAPGLNFIQVVEQRNHYFHPYGTGGWPKEPPNYIGFRYRGRLQSVHHIEKAEVIKNFHPHFPESPNVQTEPHFLYTLGPAIRPVNTVSGKGLFKSQKAWVMLDLLLTCETITEARDKSNTRMKQI